MTTRILRAAAAAILLLSLGATTMLAGGWATIVADDASPPEPRAGEDIEYGFTVLQHGVTPAGFEEPTLQLTNTITGDTFDVPAEPSGPAGHFVARFSFPSAGSWSYAVQLKQLAVETQPVTGIVLGADGSAPAVAITAATDSLRSELLPRIDRLERDLGALEEQAASLRAEVRTLTRESDELASGAAASAPNEIPVLGVVSLAVLGGALAGFAMAWLGQRREPVAVEADAAPGGRPVTT